jgi:hypothetical protein
MRIPKAVIIAAVTLMFGASTVIAAKADPPAVHEHADWRDYVGRSETNTLPIGTDSSSSSGKEDVGYNPLAWATPYWRNTYAPSIVAGETVPGCSECDLMIACTLYNDVVEGGYSPFRLYGNPGRWHGWKKPRQQHIDAVQKALDGGCSSLPRCIRLGNRTDFQYNWTHMGPAVVVGNQRGLIICVPEKRDIG